MSNSYRLEQVAIRMVKMPPLISNEPIINPEAAIRVMEPDAENVYAPAGGLVCGIG